MKSATKARTWVIALTVLVHSLFVTLAVAAEDAGTKIDFSCKGCNVVFLDIDLLRSDFFELTSHRQGGTPRMTGFFENSIIFEDVSAASGVTAISNTATLTARTGEFTYGLLQRTYVDDPPQMPREFAGLFAATPTIAEVLRGNGYWTANLNHGWYAGKQMLLDRGIDYYWGSGEVGAVDNVPGRIIRKTAEVLHDLRKSDRPFFVLMRSEDLRGLPYRYPIGRPRLEDPRVEYRKLAEANYDVYFQPLADGTLSVKFPYVAKVGWMTDEQVKEYRWLSRALYQQQLTFVDEEMARLLEVINNSEFVDNTMVVLYANHGDGLYDNRVPNHGVSYQSCVSVPLAIRHPKLKSQIRVKHSIALIDLVPTIYEMLGIQAPQGLDGVSLVGALDGSDLYPNQYLYGTDKESKFIRSGQYKLIVWTDRTRELYDLSVDPHETLNLALQRPNIVNELYSRLVSHEVEQLRRVLAIPGVNRRPLGRNF